MNFGSMFGGGGFGGFPMPPMPPGFPGFPGMGGAGGGTSGGGGMGGGFGGFMPTSSSTEESFTGFPMNLQSMLEMMNKNQMGSGGGQQSVIGGQGLI